MQRLQELRRTEPSSAQTDRGEATRRTILEAAARAFAESGYAGASLNDIIKDAGVTKGGFYFHFESKEALALAVLRHIQEQWAGQVLAATMKHSDVQEQLDAMVEALIDLHGEKKNARAIERLCVELSEDPKLRPQVGPQYEVWVDMTASLFARAQDEGIIRPEFDPRDIAEAAVGTFIGLEIMSQVQGRELGPRVRRYVELYRRAFGPIS
jgi:AcrR family transcriptional regulator